MLVRGQPPPAGRRAKLDGFTAISGPAVFERATMTILRSCTAHSAPAL